MKSSLTPPSGLSALLKISVGRKILVAFSGFFLIGFIIIHLLGNLLFHVGPEAFNLYGYYLSLNRALLTVLEIIILVGFLSHIGLVILTTWQNWKARPLGYKKRRTLGRSTLYSANMGLTGSFILLFLVVHVRGFRFGDFSLLPVPGRPGAMMNDLYSLAMTSFQNIGYSIFYILAVCLLGSHLSHGLQSALKSVGLYSENGTLDKRLKTLSYAFGIFMALGFASIPFVVVTGIIK